MANKPKEPKQSDASWLLSHYQSDRLEKRLIKRKRLVPDPRYTVVATEENTITFTRPPADHPIHFLIGQIAMEWAILENILDSCISHLADMNGVLTACFTAQLMGHAPRCLTIKALAHYRGLTDIEEAAKNLQNILYEASDLRNRAIHDRLLVESKQKTPFKDHRMSKKELTFDLQEFDISQLESTIELIKRRQQDCVKLKMILDQVYEYEP